MKKSRWTLVLSLVLVLSVFLSACGGGGSNNGGNNGGGEGNGDSASEQIMNLYATAEIPSMDTTQATDSTSFNAMNQVFEGLYRLDENNEPTLGVAAEEPKEEEKDGETVYTFTIRDDAKWSDGSAVTAEDFIYAWHKALNPETISPYASMFGTAGIKNGNAIITEGDPLYGKVEELGAKAVDEKTLEVTVENQVPYFKSLLTFATFYPQPKAFAEEQGEEFALEADTMLYNGPFVFSEWNHGEGWNYKKNPEYWDAEVVNLEEITVKVVKDTATSVNLYETGKVDRATLDADFVDQFKDGEDFSTILEPTMFFLRLNQGENEALANKDIRKALFLAYDREGLVNVLLNNGSVAAKYFVPKDFVKGPDGADFREFAKDGFFADQGEAEAKEAWEAGLEALGTDSVDFEFLTTDTELSSTIAEYAKEQFESKLDGLTITINKQPWKQFLKLEDAGDFDISTGGWGPDYPDPMTFLYMFETDGAYNRMGYSSEKYDQLVSDAKKETDEAKRWEMMQEAEKVLMEEDIAIVPTYQRGLAIIQQPYVKNYYVHTFGADASYKWVKIEGK
ncbi:peptide ABC transporter substrate-binding protein [Guptibacillus hwajinpoensis]|uniref:Oligopeptide transport system substrate-binding protein n=1 Tax=Guptibacillus hwajinpoensis TaxID=208199 RepID=A0ABU0K4V6_9BACL|nr:peptide ABC transporter substrate-binding protein [Alkalihalobacillus hemicentroti]MDQ0483428.1 oligopeptide transport system substrate-binding protein [Alkalihalobacillus hemicentroti]